MERITLSLIKHKKLIMVLFVIVSLICTILMFGVKQNYTMSRYLPDDTNSKQAINVMEKEFGMAGAAEVLYTDADIVSVLELKEKISQVEGVASVTWLDDVCNIATPIAMMDSSYVESFYLDNNALIQIEFSNADEHDITINAVEQIMSMLPENAYITGTAYMAYGDRHTMSGNLLLGIVLAVIMIVVLLLVCIESVVEVVLFLVTIGLATLINLGTNIIFEDISYMTFVCATLLQVAISMDYSIFLFHRFREERKFTDDVNLAMARAAKYSLSAISASAMTTIVGFLALLVMSYSIGKDMGIVLAKGIVLSLLCVLFVLPATTVAFVKQIDKTTHRKIIPSFKKLQKALSGKLRFVVVIIMVVVAFFTYLAQSQNTFTYASGSATDVGKMKTEEIYGHNNRLVLFVPNGDEARERILAEKLYDIDNIKTVQGFYTLVPEGVSHGIIEDSVRDRFVSENYSMYLVYADTPDESPEAYAVVEDIREAANEVYPEGAYLTGSTAVYYDIRETTTIDFRNVMALSIAAIALILILTFKSAILPILLLLVIETSIWINMSVPYFSGEGIIFIGYMIVSSVQLGATIDYAILMTGYYMDGRKTLQPREASIFAVDFAGGSICISAVVLAVAGFVISFVFEKPELSILGTLIGRGAVLSGVLAICVLPQFLVVFDKLIKKLTKGGSKLADLTDKEQ